MPKKVNRLSAVKVASIKNPGFYADGGGLYLQVTDSGSRSWVFRLKPVDVIAIWGWARSMRLDLLRRGGWRQSAAVRDCKGSIQSRPESPDVRRHNLMPLVRSRSTIAGTNLSPRTEPRGQTTNT